MFIVAPQIISPLSALGPSSLASRHLLFFDHEGSTRLPIRLRRRGFGGGAGGADTNDERRWQVLPEGTSG